MILLKYSIITILLTLALTLTESSLASPQKIIIVRHSDKLNAVTFGHTITLDPTGYLRAVKLGFYILKRYGIPDYIIASYPATKYSHHDMSLREIQTISPLSNMIASKTKRRAHVLHPYKVSQYKKLAYDLLADPKFNGKTVLICWNHYFIAMLAHSLGVRQAIAKWPDRDFDTVYILRYKNNQLDSFRILNNQYPVDPIASWGEVEKRLAKAH